MLLAWAAFRTEPPLLPGPDVAGVVYTDDAGDPSPPHFTLQVQSIGVTDCPEVRYHVRFHAPVKELQVKRLADVPFEVTVSEAASHASPAVMLGAQMETPLHPRWVGRATEWEAAWLDSTPHLATTYITVVNPSSDGGPEYGVVVSWTGITYRKAGLGECWLPMPTHSDPYTIEIEAFDEIHGDLEGFSGSPGGLLFTCGRPTAGPRDGISPVATPCIGSSGPEVFVRNAGLAQFSQFLPLAAGVGLGVSAELLVGVLVRGRRRRHAA